MSNPHFDKAIKINNRVANANGLEVHQAMYEMACAQMNATLALAFEQRTANLIAFANACETGHCDNGGAFRQAATRLGLGDTK